MRIRRAVLLQELLEVYEVPHEGYGLLPVVSQLLDRVVTRLAESQDRRCSIEHLAVRPAVEALHGTISGRHSERAMEVQHIGDACAFGEDGGGEVPGGAGQGEGAV